MIAFQYFASFKPGIFSDLCVCGVFYTREELSRFQHVSFTPHREERGTRLQRLASVNLCWLLQFGPWELRTCSGHFLRQVFPPCRSAVRA